MNNHGEHRQKKLALFAIFSLPVLWGAGFPLTHNAVEYIHPGLFLFYRQVIAVACLLLFVWKLLPQINKKIIIGGFFIGLSGTVSIACQCFALTTVSSAMTAFFVSLNIIFIPFLSLLFGLSRPKIIDISAVILGVSSLFIAFNGSFSDMKSGDLLGLLSAVGIAMYITTIQIVTKNDDVNRLLLTFVSTLFGVIFLSYFPLTVSHPLSFTEPKVYVALIYQGAISTALCFLILVMFQKQVGETRTAIILNLDLLFASLFGLINGESLTINQVIGGCIALLASVFHEFIAFVKNKTLQFKKIVSQIDTGT